MSATMIGCAGTKRAGAVLLAAWAVLALAPRSAAAGEPDSAGSAPAKVGVKAYVDFSAGQQGAAAGDSSTFGRVAITRAYLIVKKKLTPYLGARITPDAHQDDDGNYAVRLKYMYGEVYVPDLGPLTHMVAEVGMGHMPWLDFEEHINLYRCQGTMAVERAGTFNSADLGVSLRGYIGEPLDDAKARTGNAKYAGKWGTWHVGIYNGGGYHAVEKNENKAVEGRLTIRPLPGFVPGLQLSYFGLYAKGNVEGPGDSLPLYSVNMGMLSYEHPWVVLTAQAFLTHGNAKGDWVDNADDALKTFGYSVFGNLRVPVGSMELAAFGRYDSFNADQDEKLAEKGTYQMIIAGVSLDLYKGNMIVLAYEGTFYGDDFAGKKKVPTPGTKLGDDHKGQIVYQVKY